MSLSYCCFCLRRGAIIFDHQKDFFSSKNSDRTDAKMNIMRCEMSAKSKINLVGGSPGLVVVGGDSCSECRGFKSQLCILDGHFSHIFVVKIVMFV